MLILAVVSQHSQLADGLYVLLRPAKKNNKKKQEAIADVPQPPPHLWHMLMKENLPETCPWSLSGPQFPQPTAIQQRYCYPRGRPEYSGRKGGALWTMYGADGKEDTEYRLLHVYFSAKRAINKGMSGIPDGGTAEDIRSPPRKRQPRQRSTTPIRAGLPKRRHVEHPPQHPPELYHSPAITTSSVTSSSLCNSPLSFDNLPHLSFPDAPATNGSEVYPSWPEQLIVTPTINDIVEIQQKAPYQAPAASHPSHHHHHHHQGYYSEDNHGSMEGAPTPSPFRRPITTPASTINVQKSPLLRTGEYYSIDMPHSSEEDTTSISSSDPFHLDFPLQQEIDSFWSDPLMTIMMKPSQDYYNANDNTEQHHHHPERVFALRLESLQESIRERILAAPIRDQPKLVSVMATWARQMAMDPLAAVVPKEEDGPHENNGKQPSHHGAARWKNNDGSSGHAFSVGV